MGQVILSLEEYSKLVSEKAYYESMFTLKKDYASKVVLELDTDKVIEIFMDLLGKSKYAKTHRVDIDERYPETTNSTTYYVRAVEEASMFEEDVKEMISALEYKEDDSAVVGGDSDGN